jgi:hypothetical protein
MKSLKIKTMKLLCWVFIGGADSLFYTNFGTDQILNTAYCFLYCKDTQIYRSVFASFSAAGPACSAGSRMFGS